MNILLAAIFFCISSTQNLALIEIPEYVTCASFNNLATEPENIKGSFCKRHMRVSFKFDIQIRSNKCLGHKK